MMSKNSIVPFLKDYLIKFLTRPFLLDTNELVSKIQEVYATFSTDAALQIEKGNKAAGTRARKTSLELEKLMKEFRKVSLEESKK